jgi:hypothetical protein
MDVKVNLLDIKIDKDENIKDEIQINSQISIKLKYPEFSIMEKATKFESSTDLAFQMIIDSIEYIYDGQQFHYAKESTEAELIEFVESLNREQFAKIEEFFDNLPKLNKKIEIKCGKCGFDHTIEVEGLESFFG